MAESHEEVIGMVVKLAAESTDFQNQMSTLNRQMKVLQSDYKATASSSKDFENTMVGMTAKSDYLNNALKTQQSIVEAHSTRLEKSKQRLSDLAEAQVQLKSKLDSTKSSYEEAVKLHGEESEEAQKLASELKALQVQYDKNNDKVNALSRTIDNQTISYNNARSTLSNLEGQLKETEQAMEEMGHASKSAAESADFQNQMSDLDRQMKVLQSSYKAVASSSKDFESTMEGMAAKSDYLNSALKIQENIVEAHSTKLEKSKQKLADLTEAQAQLKSKLDSTKSSYEEAVKLHGEESEEAQKLASELKALQVQYDKNNDKVNDLSRTIDNQTISYNNARSTLNNLEGQLRETEQAMEEMGDASNNVSHNMNNLQGTGSPFSSLISSVKEAVGETKLFGVSLSDIGGALTGTVNPASLMTGAVAGITSALTDLVMQGIQKAIEALGQLIVNMVSIGNELGAQISRVQAISGATGAATKGISDLARELGRSTVYSATEAAKALEYTALAGWKLEDMASGMPGILDLAAASGEDLALVSDILTDQLTAFGMATSESARMADVMAAAMSNSNTNVEQLGKALEYCGPLAGQAGFSIEDVSLAIGLMANASIKGEKAGTALRKLFTEMPSGLKVTSKSFGEMEIATVHADGSFRKLKDILIDLRKAFSQMTESERLLNSEAISAKTGMSGLAAMVNATEKDFNKLTMAIDHSAGAVGDMAEKMNDNIAGLQKSINSKFEDIIISLYSIIEPIYSMILKVVETVLNNLSQTLKPMADFLVAILDPIRSIFNAMMDIIQLFTDKILPIINGPLKILTSALRGIGVIIKELCSGIVTLAQTLLGGLEPAIQSIDGLCNGIAEGFQLIVDVVGRVFNVINTFANSLVVCFQNANLMIMNCLTGNKEAADKMWQEIEKSTNDVFIALGESLGINMDFMRKEYDLLEKEVNKNFKSIAEVCGESTDKVWTSFEEMYNKIQELDDETYSQLKESADGYYNEYHAKLKGVSKYEEEQLKKKMDKWDATHKSMEGSLSYYIKREEYYAQQVEAISNRTASKKESINHEYTSKMEQEFKKQQDLYEQYASSNYQGDYESFAKIEEAKTKKYKKELENRSKIYESWSGGIGKGKFSADITGVSGWGNSDLPRYAVGTNHHPGGLAIVGERGPELANLPRGTSVSTNGDTATLLRNANSDVVSELSVLIGEVRSLKITMNRNARNEAAIIGLK